MTPSAATTGSLRFGYGTNGFHSHRLGDTLAVLADLGYDGVALTLDHLHLDPFAPDAAAQVAALGRRLEALGLGLVVETGARYLLDPWRKHHPTLVSTEGRPLRQDYLRRAVDVGAELGADAVSFWSGTPEPGTSPRTAWDRLVEGTAAVLAHARERGVTLGFEPEPGMLVETVADVRRLRASLGDPEGLGLTLDVGHVVCNEPRGLAETITGAGDLLVNVQLDDMVRGVHEHLELGQGEVDLTEALGALADVGYRGLASLELPRQSHRAPRVAAESLTRLHAAVSGATSAARQRAFPELVER